MEHTETHSFVFFMTKEEAYTETEEEWRNFVITLKRCLIFTNRSTAKSMQQPPMQNTQANLSDNCTITMITLTFKVTPSV